MSKVTRGPAAPVVPPQEEVPAPPSGEDVVTPGVKPAALTATTKAALEAFRKRAAAIDLNTESMEDFQKGLAELQAIWPYDTSIPMTDEQLQEMGAVDLTNDARGLNIFIGLGGGLGTELGTRAVGGKTSMKGPKKSQGKAPAQPKPAAPKLGKLKFYEFDNGWARPAIMRVGEIPYIWTGSEWSPYPDPMRWATQAKEVTKAEFDSLCAKCGINPDAIGDAAPLQDAEETQAFNNELTRVQEGFDAAWQSDLSQDAPAKAWGSYSMVAGEIPSVVDQLHARGAEGSWAVLMFESPFARPGEDGIINLQFSNMDGITGLDWVLLAIQNIVDKPRVIDFITASGHAVSEREMNGVRFLRVEDGDVAALGSRIVSEFYMIEPDTRFGLLVDGFDYEGPQGAPASLPGRGDE